MIESNSPVHMSEIVFEVTEEADGGYSAECLTENIFTQGETWDQLRANAKEATEAYFYDGPKPKYIRLHLVRNEVLGMKLPRDLSGRDLAEGCAVAGTIATLTKSGVT